MNQIFQGKLFITLSILWAFACVQSNDDDHVCLCIVQTSDIHGAFFPVNYAEGTERPYSMANIAAYVKSMREADSCHVVLIDNGDIIQGDPSVYYYNFEVPEVKHIASRAMNYLQYQAMTPGNHDIEAGHKVYDRLPQEMNFPLIAANIIDKSSGKPYFKPYTIIDIKGIRIAILGLITPAIPNWLPENIWEGMYFQDMLEAASQWVPYIQENEKPHILIGMFHAGVDYTASGYTKESVYNENASKLVAEQIPGFDIVFAGHDHRGWNEVFFNQTGDEVLLLAPRAYAQNVAVAEITGNKSKYGWEINKRGFLQEMSDFSPDEVYLEAFKNAMDSIEAWVNEPIGYLRGKLDASESLFGDNAFTDLIHTLQLELSDAQISISAPLSMSMLLEPGVLKISDMFKLYRYENLLYTMQLSGKEVKDLLEHAAGLWFTEKGVNDNTILAFKKDQNGDFVKSVHHSGYELKNPFFNFDSAEGIIYEIDLSKKPGHRVNIKSMSDGGLFSPDSIYKVAINSYRGNGGGGHLTIGAGIDKKELSERILYSTDLDLRYYLKEFIKNRGNWVPEVNHNWRIVPESFVDSKAGKDRALLFGNP
ncbi:MAG: 5'-nucleotidase C-terminal domain-containing protein [Cyclobacteriaceae bacterium]|nr:5'-nucleotidase C-terminal domain-containing protein [Cyclobacteriaceae bacterium]